jgi:hypothetical protein
MATIAASSADKTRPGAQAAVPGRDISRQALVSLVTGYLNGYPSDDSPMPHGPWDPVIRRVLDRVATSVRGPHPEPWRAVTLNPQPLPPRIAFAASFAEEIVDRAALLQEAGGRAGSGYVTRFIDDYCGTPPRRRWPFPWPPKDDRINPLDLVTIGVTFQNLARTLENEDLAGQISKAGGALVDRGAAGG